MWWPSNILISRFAQALATIIFWYMYVFRCYLNMSQLGLKMLGIISKLVLFWMTVIFNRDET